MSNAGEKNGMFGQTPDNWVDLTGKVFGKLTALHQTTKNKYHVWKWLCQCECGVQVEVLSYSLRHGHTKSCGCSRYKVSPPPGVKSIEESSWRALWKNFRVKHEKHPISISFEEWRSICEKPCVYCGEMDTKKPERYPAMPCSTVDRIDSNKNYELGNCQPMCKKHNSMKSNMTEADFFESILKIVKYRKLLE